jgi:hypothetical protein
MATTKETPANTTDDTKAENRTEAFLRISEDRARFKHKLEVANAKIAEQAKQLEDIQVEITGLRTKADTSASARRVAELEQQIREIGHRKVFDSVALKPEIGARPEALDDLWSLSGYKAEGDPDPDVIGALLSEQKGKRSYLFGGATSSQEKPPPKPGPASGQSKPPPGAPQLLDDGDPRHSDVLYQFTNWREIQKAAADKVARGEV